jgi:ubiquinone/menaquinone biosynthesis C-methylase UbiE
MPDITAEFDRLAAFDDGRWDHNSRYHGFLLRHLPERRDAALEVGCGTGTFSRALARHFGHVLAIDLSGEMLRRARSRASGVTKVEFRQADLFAETLAAASFDCVAAIATLHHLPLVQALERMAAMLRPGGVLLVSDLYQARTVVDWAVCGAAVPANVLLNLWTHGRIRQRADARRAWVEHARHDVYPTLAEVRRVAARLMPGAIVRRHLFWRYSLVWRKPTA